MTYYHLGLVGLPLEHSLSPQIHMAALKAQHLEGRYDLFPFPPTSEGFEGIQSLIEQMHRGDLHGLNVTIPHKITLIPYLDRLTPISRAIGAVNALRLEGDELVGDNFDCASFLADLTLQLKQAGLLALCQRPGRSALVLGAGGSAPAVVYGVLSQGRQGKLAPPPAGPTPERGPRFFTDLGHNLLRPGWAGELGCVRIRFDRQCHPIRDASGYRCFTLARRAAVSLCGVRL